MERISKYIHKVSIRKKEHFILMLCRYWSLKREARRGAPLLKRLHLEPWTANASGRVVSDEEKKVKIEVSRGFSSFALFVLNMVVAAPTPER